VSRATAAAAVGIVLLLAFSATASASAPTITYSIDGISGTNGWYRGSANGDNVVLHWAVSLDATSSDCLAAVTIPGPTGGATETCSAGNLDGSTTAVTRVIKIDATPPTSLTASFSRGPDSNGWYNHPVTVSWSGSDATSGIAGCSSVTYQGPDNGVASASGGCTDVAGNSASSTVLLAYDATPPVLQKVAESSEANANLLRWASSDTADRIVVYRSVRGSTGRSAIFHGSSTSILDRKIQPGVEYEYSIQAFDQAGNASRPVSVAGLPKVLTMQKMRYVPRAAPHPILRWSGVRGADYYNVQLFRGAKRVFAAWPGTHQLGLPATWRWGGHRYRLVPGRYRWYVWAGLGPRTLARYRTIGSGSFIVPRG
jgi:hypothetical protein